MSGTSDARRGMAALVATAALWGSNHAVARAVSEIVPLPALVFWRWMIGATLLTVFAVPALRKTWPTVRTRLADLVIGGVVGVGIFSYFLLGGAYYSPVVEVGLLNATTPVWVVLIGWLTGVERPQLRTLAGLAVALAGALLIVCRGDLVALLHLQLSFGNALSVLGAISFAWFSLRVRVWSRELDLLSITVITAWAGLLLVMLPAYIVWLLKGGAALHTGDGPAWVAVASIGYIGIGPTLAGNLLYLFGVTRVGAARAAVYLYLSPVFSAALAVGVLGERLAWFHIAGAVTAVCGLALLRDRSDRSS